MVISLRLSEVDGELVKLYAFNKGVTVSTFIRDVVLDRIESDFNIISKKGEVISKELDF